MAFAQPRSKHATPEESWRWGEEDYGTSAYPASHEAVHSSLLRELNVSHRESSALLEAERRECSRQVEAHVAMHSATVDALRHSLAAAEADGEEARARELAAIARAEAAEQQFRILEAVSVGEVRRLGAQLRAARAELEAVRHELAAAPKEAAAAGIVAELWSLVQQQESAIRDLMAEGTAAEQ